MKRITCIFGSQLALASLLFISSTNCFSQPVSLVKQILDSARADRSTSIDMRPLLLPGQAPIALVELQPATRDTLTRVRQAAYRTLAYLSQRVIDTTGKQQALSLLTAGLTDNESTIIRSVSSALRQVNRQTFTPVVVQRIRLLLRSGQKNLSEVCRLLGFIGDQSDRSRLSLLLTAPGLDAATSQSIRLALVRLGDAALRGQLVSKLKGQVVNSNFMVFALTDLLYTRQKEIVDVLVTKLYSNESNCEGATPTARINCAYQLMISLAPFIVDYPIQVDEFGESSLPATNEAYIQTLATVRDWFTAHTDYRMRNDIY
ncbi:hypothetical protein [Spirosoma foliorum]|uniref:HEAT repeat domain-containing protein n=1 Tax=Spirosoma foliorum TaxID=2710596 RepID=A0A7G5GWU0_9BACT|nr:hypothetical protein [Spirosoma foliorum]QMW03332.1 hypothetical protein H3H32_36690 [Spirosoma foliorum]